LPSLDAQERQLDERVLVTARDGGIDQVGLLLFPLDERDAP